MSRLASYNGGMERARRPVTPPLHERLYARLNAHMESLVSTPSARRRAWIFMGFIFLLQIATVALVISSRDVGNEGTEVMAFVRDMKEESSVIVDGEHFIGERKRALLDPLKNLSRTSITVFPRQSFQVRLRDGDRRLTLLLDRIGDSREYRVYLVNQDGSKDPEQVGWIETGVLDGMEPIHPAPVPVR